MMKKMVGSRFGPYEITAKLGAGGMGEVYRAKDTRLKREVAIKIISPEVFDAGRKNRFQREAEAASALNHPNILVVYDIGNENGRSYIVSELIDGETLRNHVQKGPISIKQLLDLARQIVAGLAAAHQNGIVHRDLKPENIMITLEGQVKILDFGLAKLFNVETTDPNSDVIRSALTETSQGIIQGTVPYMSPEQATGSKVDFRSDQFSLGTILFEMATNKHPFQRETPAQTMSAIISEEPRAASEFIAKLPAPVRWFIERCLSKDPKDRYDSTHDLLKEINTLNTHYFRKEAFSISSEGPTQEKYRRKIWNLVTALLMVSLAVTAIIFYEKSFNANILSYHRVTYRRGYVSTARFAPDGQTIIYTGSFEGNASELFLTRIQGVESRPIGIQNAHILSISTSGQMAVLLQHPIRVFSEGILADVPLSGGAPREIADHVWGAAWTPDSSKLAVVRRVSNKSRIELPLGTVLYESPAFIRDLRFSSDGTMIAFAEHAFVSSVGAATIIDLNGRKLASSKDIYPEGIAWFNSTELWITSLAVKGGGGSELYGLKPSGKQRLIQRFPRSVLHDISATGLILLTNDEIRGITTALLDGKERDVSIFDETGLADLSSDGTTLLLSETGESSEGLGTVYLRKISDAAAVRLGEGWPSNLSKDGKSALVFQEDKSRLQLLPTGVGEAKSYNIGPYLSDHTLPHPTLFPDGKNILFLGKEKGHGTRVYIQDVAGGKPLPVTTQGVDYFQNTISPDCNFFVGRTNEKIYLYPLKSGQPSEIVGIHEGEIPFQWNTDGKTIYVYNPNILPVQINRVNPFTAERTLIKEWFSSTAGIVGISNPRLTDDGKTFVIKYEVDLSTLYLVQGLKKISFF